VADSNYADPNKLPPEKKAAKLVFDSYDRSRRLLVDPKRDQWKEWYRAYRSVIDLGTDDNFVSQLVVPLIFTNVEDFLPRLAAQTPKIEVWPRSSEDSRRASVHRALLKYDWQILNMVYRIVEFVKSAEIYGTAWMKTSYRKTEEVRARRVPGVVLGPDGQPTGERKLQMKVGKTLTYDDPWVDILEVDQVFPDPDGISVDECQYIIHRARSSLHEVESARRDGKPLYDQEAVDKLKRHLVNGSNPVTLNSGTQTLREEAQERFNETRIESPDPYKREFHLLEYWERGKVIVVVEELRGTEIPPLRNDWNEVGHLPFVQFTPIPDTNSIYGLSIPEILMSLQVELSLLHSVRLDNLLSTVHQMWTIIRGSGINARNLRFRPGGILPVRDHDDIRPLQSPSMDFTIYREANEVKDLAQRVGATDTFQGIGSPGATATEANILAEASGSRAALMFRILGHQTLTPLGRQLMRLNELYVDTDRNLSRILGDDFNEQQFDQTTGAVSEAPPQFDKITPEELISKTGIDMDVTIDLATVEPGNAQVRLARAERVLPTLLQTLPPNHPAVEAALVEFFRGSGISERPESLFNSPQAQQSIEEQRAAEQAENQGGEEENTAPPGENAGSLAELLSAEGGSLAGGQGGIQ